MYVALLQLRGQGARDPADGFISFPLNSSNFVIHKPYELPVSERYMCVTNGVHKLWVLSTCKPLSPTSPTASSSFLNILGLLKVFIDGDLKLAAKGRGGASHYFKCGVYAQNYSSYFMESLWKDVKVLKLPD